MSWNEMIAKSKYFGTMSLPKIFILRHYRAVQVLSRNVIVESLKLCKNLKSLQPISETTQKSQISETVQKSQTPKTVQKSQISEIVIISQSLSSRWKLSFLCDINLFLCFMKLLNCVYIHGFNHTLAPQKSKPCKKKKATNDFVMLSLEQL